jgi:hypothetical protein
MDDLIFNLNFLLIALNFLLCFYNFKKFEPSLKILTAYMFYLLLIGFAIKITFYFNKPIVFISHFFFIGQFFFLSIFYLNILKDVFQKKSIKIIMILVSIILIIQYIFDPNLLYKFNLFEIYVISFVIIVYVFYHFYEMLNAEKYHLYNSVSILLYQLGCVFLFSAGNLFLKNNPKYNLFTFDLNNILGIIAQIIVFVGWRNYFITQKRIKNGF